MGNFFNSGLFSKLFLSILFVFSLALTTSVKAQGQFPLFPWNLEIRAGAAIPTGDLAETVNVGTDIGARFGFSLRERLMLRADIETELYSGAPGFENTQLWHYSGGLEYMVTDRGLTDWRLSGFGGLGATTITSDNVTDISETYFSINYGAKLGRGINDNLDCFLSVMGRSVFANSSDNTNAGIFTTIPITLGLNYRFNLGNEFPHEY